MLLEKRPAAADVMEWVGLDDEFRRVERKWVEPIASGNDRRRPGDPERLDQWFDRPARQIDRVLRSPPDVPAVPLLRATRATRETRETIASRSRDTAG